MQLPVSQNMTPHPAAAHDGVSPGRIAAYAGMTACWAETTSCGATGNGLYNGAVGGLFGALIPAVEGIGSIIGGALIVGLGTCVADAVRVGVTRGRRVYDETYNVAQASLLRTPELQASRRIVDAAFGADTVSELEEAVATGEARYPLDVLDHVRMEHARLLTSMSARTGPTLNAAELRIVTALRGMTSGADEHQPLPPVYLAHLSALGDIWQTMAPPTAEKARARVSALNETVIGSDDQAARVRPF